jgi:hypothetical protein
MLHHFNCPTICGNPKVATLVFDWNDETGEVTGKDAEYIHDSFAAGNAAAHPYPWSWKLTSTKNKTDMAAVVGWNHVLPDVLKDHYPRLKEDDWPEEDCIGEDGIPIIGKKSLVF